MNRLHGLIVLLLLPVQLWAQQIPQQKSYGSEEGPTVAEPAKRKEADDRLIWKEALRNSLAGFRELSYIQSGETGYNVALGRYWFEANLNPEYVIAPRINLKRKHHQAAFFLLAPQVQFRMFQGNSSPIRTASFIPTFHTYYLPTIDREDQDRWNYLFGATVAHFSNGSSGDFFLPATPGQPRGINVENGNFSTNFLTATVGQYKYWNRSATSRMARYLSLQYRVQVFGGIPNTALEHEPGLEGRFGRVRTHFQGRFITEVGAHPDKIRQNRRYRHELGVDLLASYIWSDQLERFGSTDLERRLSVRTQLLWRPAWAYEMALIGQVYWGHDYYNIWFPNQVTSFTLGLEAAIPPFILRRERPRDQIARQDRIREQRL